MTEYELSASHARHAVRKLGLADCIHFAPDWRPRADALYEECNSLGLRHWEGDSAIGLLADGRMAYVWGACGIAEVSK